MKQNKTKEGGKVFMIVLADKKKKKYIENIN